MELSEDTILGFWQWFVMNEDRIKECIEDEHSINTKYIVDQMNEQILGMGLLTWDIGLNEEERWFLMLSPNGKKDMLEVSQRIMDAAPEHMPWLFYASKPAKNWNRQFTIYDDFMDEQLIDASAWNYVLFHAEDEDKQFELVIEAKNIPSSDSELAITAAEQFLIQEVGEITRIQLISSIEIVHTLDSEDESSKVSIDRLKRHLEGMS